MFAATVDPVNVDGKSFVKLEKTWWSLHCTFSNSSSSSSNGGGGGGGGRRPAQAWHEACAIYAHLDS